MCSRNVTKWIYHNHYNQTPCHTHAWKGHWPIDIVHSNGSTSRKYHKVCSNNLSNQLENNPQNAINTLLNGVWKPASSSNKNTDSSKQVYRLANLLCDGHGRRWCTAIEFSIFFGVIGWGKTFFHARNLLAFNSIGLSSHYHERSKKKNDVKSDKKRLWRKSLLTNGHE